MKIEIGVANSRLNLTRNEREHGSGRGEAAVVKGRSIWQRARRSRERARPTTRVRARDITTSPIRQELTKHFPMNWLCFHLHPEFLLKLQCLPKYLSNQKFHYFFMCMCEHNNNESIYLNHTQFIMREYYENYLLLDTITATK